MVFSAKSYKCLSKIKIVKQSNQTIKFHRVNRIFSSIRHIDYLDLSSLKVQKPQIPQLKSFLKKFYNIKQFSSPCPWGKNIDKGLLFVLLSLLKNGRYLKDLSIRGSFSELPWKLFNWMKPCKIKTLQYDSSEKYQAEEFIALLELCPSSLEDLTLSGELLQPIPKIVKFQFPWWLENLQKVELGISLPGDDLCALLMSIPDPSKLKSLQFRLIDSKPQAVISGKIEGFLRRCVYLEELHMRTEASGMMDFSVGATDMRLKKLAIKQDFGKDDDLLKLESLLENQRDSLESFRLILKVSEKNPGNFEILYRSIKSLKNLKRIDLELRRFSASWKMPIYRPFAEILESLNGLEEIDFRWIPPDSENKKEDFARFCKAVQKHSLTLRSFEFSLEGCEYPNLLILALKNFSKLESLTLTRLKIEEAKGLSFYNELRDLVCYKIRGLNSVEISELRRKGDHENFLQMLREIIRKPTMKKFAYEEGGSFGLPLINSFRTAGVIDLSEILKEVYHLESLYLPPDDSPAAFKPYEVDRYKWQGNL